MQKNLMSLMFMGPYDQQLLQQQRLEESQLQSNQQFYSNKQNKEAGDASIKNLQHDIMQDLREANSISMLDN